MEYDGMMQDSQSELDKRRELRHKYHQKKLEIQEEREALTADISQLNQKLDEVDELFAEVKNPREAALDSNVIRMVAAIGTQKAKDLNIQLKRFEPSEFVEKAVTFMKGGQRTPNIVSPNGWDLLGAEVVQFFVKPPTFHFINGSFERGEIVRKERNVRKREKEAPTKTVTPEEVSDTGKEKPEQTTEEVQRIMGILQYHCKDEKIKERTTYKPICYFEFVTNPDSFGATIENIFHVSFLVKDGWARIRLDTDGLPTIEPLQKKEDGDDGAQKNEQFIMSLNMDEWEEIKKVFRMKRPLIPSRKNVKDKIAEK